MMLPLLLASLSQAGIVIAECLLNWWLQSTLLIAAGLIIGSFVRKRGAALQSVVYQTTLVAVVLCPVATGLLSLGGVTGWSLHWPSTVTGPTANNTRLAGTASPQIQISNLDAGPRNSLTGTHGPEQQAGSSSANLDAPVSATQDDSLIDPNELQSNFTAATGISTGSNSSSPIQKPSSVTIPLTAWLAIGLCTAWIVVSTISLIRVIKAVRQVNRLRRDSVLAEVETHALCGQLATLMCVKAPEVRHSPFVSSPFLSGLINPVVILPDAEPELRIREILIHEIAHLRRCDCHWNLVLQLVTSVVFFQPLIWILGRRIEASAEDVCDDYVVRYGGNRADYAHQLADIAERGLAPSLAVGVGMLSFRSMLARRVARIMDGSRTLSTRVGNVMLLLTLVCGSAATLTVGLLGLSERRSLAENEPAAKPLKNDQVNPTEKNQESPTPRAKPPSETKPQVADESVFTHQGVVVDPNGKPVAGAKLHLMIYVHDSMRPIEPTWKPVAVTNANGEFRFGKNELNAYRPAEPNNLDGASLCAVAEGYGFAWTMAALFETSGVAIVKLRETLANAPEQYRAPMLKTLEQAGQPLRLKLDDQPIKGRVVNIDGEPVVGAKLTLLQVATGHDELLDDWLNKTKLERADYYSTREGTPKSINSQQVRSLVTPAITDSQGNFEVRGVGRDRIAEFLVEGPGIQSDKILARTQEGETIELPDQWKGARDRNLIYHPRQLIHVAGPSQPIVGVVVDKVTQQPIPGALVISQKRHGHPINGWGQDFVRTVADAQGRFRLEGMPIGNDNRIAALPPSNLAYLAGSKSVKTTAELEPSKVDFELYPGVWVTGRVSDKQTGEGLSGRFDIYSFRGNPAIERGHVDERQRLISDLEGNFRVVAPLGRGIIGFMADRHENYPRGAGAKSIEGGKSRSGDFVYFETGPRQCSASNHHVLAEINPSAEATEIKLDLTLDAGRNVKGHVVDPSGKPLLNAVYTGKIKGFNGLWDHVTPGGGFEITEYDPQAPRQVTFSDSDNSLAGIVVLSGTLPNPLVITLQPAGKAKGRIVDGEGDPIANAQLTGWKPPQASPDAMMEDGDAVLSLPPTDSKRYRDQLFADAEGRFEIVGLIPDKDYFVEVRSRDQRKFHGRLDVVINVKAGEVRDLGDVRVTKDKPPSQKAKNEPEPSLETPGSPKSSGETKSSK